MKCGTATDSEARHDASSHSLGISKECKPARVVAGSGKGRSLGVRNWDGRRGGARRIRSLLPGGTTPRKALLGAPGALGGAVSRMCDGVRLGLPSRSGASGVHPPNAHLCAGPLSNRCRGPVRRCWPCGGQLVFPGGALGRSERPLVTLLAEDNRPSRREGGTSLRSEPTPTFGDASGWALERPPRSPVTLLRHDYVGAHTARLGQPLVAGASRTYECLKG